MSRGGAAIVKVTVVLLAVVALWTPPVAPSDDMPLILGTSTIEGEQDSLEELKRFEEAEEKARERQREETRGGSLEREKENPDKEDDRAKLKEEKERSLTRYEEEKERFKKKREKRKDDQRGRRGGRDRGEEGPSGSGPAEGESERGRSR